MTRHLGAIGFDAVKHLVVPRIERRPPRLNLKVYLYLPRAKNVPSRNRWVYGPAERLRVCSSPSGISNVTHFCDRWIADAKLPLFGIVGGGGRYV